MTREERRWGDPRVQLVVFALAHVAIFAALFRGVYSMPESGTGLFYQYGSAIVAGQVPYRDVFVEYPPFALVFFTIPRVLGDSFRWYYVWYQAEVILADLVVLAVLYGARDRDTPPWRILAPYTALLLAVGPITLHQYDLFPAALTLVAVVCHARRRDAAAWIFLAIGALTKVYPALLAPVFLLLDDTPLVPRVRRAAVVFSATCLVVLTPLLIIAPASLGRMVAFHSERGVHLDSVYATIAFAARAVGLTFVGISLSFRSVNITGPAATVLARLSTPLLGAALVAAYGFIAWHSTRLSGASRRDVRVIATSSTLVLLAGVSASKVLSPQYLIWVLPLLPLAVAPRRGLVWSIFTAIGLLTYYIYPLRYPNLLALESSTIVVLAARNLLLIALTLIVARSLRTVSNGQALDRAGAS